MFKRLITYAVDHPKQIALLTLAAVLVALLQFPRITVDTDPENMLPYDAPARAFHRDVKAEFAVSDMVVLGVVNRQDPNGVFNVQTLGTIYDITEKIKKIEGVIVQDLMAPSTKDNVQQDGIGAVRFNWLMPAPPQTQEEALQVRRQAEENPMFYGTLVSENGRMMCLYIPIERKDISYEVAQQVRAMTAQYPGDEEYYITGLPVANDQFGVEMFKQMAVSAPLAGLIIFLLMWYFFKSPQLIVAPMLVAVATVLMSMGLLIGFGFPVHIMSSMIPIFLMPIAVLDSVHILSEFFDKYSRTKDRRQTILFVIEELFSPMLFTSLTSAVGFFSLSFSPIPPVQVFGVVVGVGILMAWVLTIVFIPAYIMLINNKSFAKLDHIQSDDHSPALNRVLAFFKNVSVRHSRAVLVFVALLMLVSFYGISRIQVNDNPVRWFSEKHSIRVADRVLNENFGGTYEAYLVLSAGHEQAQEEIFIRPEMLRYVETLQQRLLAGGKVGKSTSLADIVKKIYYELLGGDKVNNVIPQTKEAVAQCLISFENSHKPDDLWHLTTPDYSKLNIWVQLKSGDNKDMAGVVAFVENYMKNNPPPFAVRASWAGLSYINVVWQNEMVMGMLKNFLGSFVIVLFMMLFLFRSPVKALISMVPLTLTILFIYSLLGFVGKDYDMPVAVLSALTLGLSIDFAIHFIQRAIEIHREKGDWPSTADEMFQGPGRAIVRNALVVAIGFLPLLAAPLVPYKTVGFFMFMIMTVSSIATLFILPAIISIKPAVVFDESEKPFACRCGHCLMIGGFVACAVAYILYGYTAATWPPITGAVILTVALFSAICHFASKSKICMTKEEKT